MYIQIMTVTTDKPASDKTPTPVHALIKARWRLCRKHSGVPRSRVSIPKTCAKWLWRMTEEKSSVPVQQHFVLPNVPLFFIPLPIFYSPRREVVILRYIMFILYPFGQRYTSIFSLMNACYLGFHLN